MPITDYSQRARSVCVSLSAFFIVVVVVVVAAVSLCNGLLVRDFYREGAVPVTQSQVSKH